VIPRLLAKFSYLAVFALLLGGGLGLPFPEEVVQLTTGFLVRQGTLSAWPAVVAIGTGILAGDYVLFRLGRSHGARVMASRHLKRFFTPERRAWVEGHFANHDFLTVVAARLLFPLRLPVFASAGAMGVRTATFLLADGVAALVSVPVVFGLGYLFAAQVVLVRERMHQAEVGAILILAGLGLAWSTVRRQRGARLVLTARPALRWPSFHRPGTR